MPLIYLDAGTINRIADGRVRRELVDELHDALAACGATVVLSLAHLADFLNGTDAETHARVAAAVNAFPAVAYLCNGPLATEVERFDRVARAPDTRESVAQEPPWSPTMRPVHSFAQDLLGDAALMHGVEVINALGREMHRAETLKADARRADRDEPRRDARQDKEVRLSTLALLASLEPGDHVDTLRVRAARVLPAPAMPQFEAMLSSGALTAVAEQLSATRIAHGLSPDTFAKKLLAQQELAAVGVAGAELRGDVDGWLDVALDVAPGVALRAQVERCNVRNVRRVPLMSDRADAMHVGYLPYVDVGVVDANNFAAIARLLPRLRRARVLKDPGPELGPLVAAIRGLARTD